MIHSEKTQWNCLPGAHIQDVAKRLPSLVKAEDYNLLLLFHVGLNDAGTKRFQNIKRDFRSLRKKLKGSEAQVLLSSTLLVGHWDSGRVKQVDGVNDCCKTVPCLGLWVCDLECALERLGLLAPGGVHLTKQCKGGLETKFTGLRAKL